MQGLLLTYIDYQQLNFQCFLLLLPKVFRYAPLEMPLELLQGHLLYKIPPKSLLNN